jgi:AraC-like DNA-binding protein
MSESRGVTTVSFSTDELPETERAAMWREHYGRTLFRVDIEPVKEQPFHACVTSRSVPGLRLMQGIMSPARVTRTKEYIADGNNELALVINQIGETAVRARGQEIVLREGDGVLMSSEEITAFDRSCRGGSCSLRIPHSMLSPLVVDIDDAVMRHIPRHTEAIRLLTSYVSALLDGNALRIQKLRQSSVTHVYDLVALILGAESDVEDIARTRGLRAARLRKARAYVIENSGRHDLSIGSVAAHLGITPRYLQRLFESSGSTFTAFLLGQRLARAHRMLCDSRFAERPVSTVAYDAGFSDLSYFNRCFRKQYGLTPRDVRAAS